MRRLKGFADSGLRRRFERVSEGRPERVANLAQYLRAAVLGIGDGSAWRDGVLADPRDPEGARPVDRPFVEDVDLVPLAAARDPGFLAMDMARTVRDWPVLPADAFRLDRGFGSAPVYATSPACRIPFEADPWWLAMTALALAQVRAMPSELLETAYDGTRVEAQLERVDKLLWALANVIAVRGLGSFTHEAQAWAGSSEGIEALTAPTPARRELMARRFAEAQGSLGFLGEAERGLAVDRIRHDLCPWDAEASRIRPVHQTAHGLSRRTLLAVFVSRRGRDRTT